MISLFLLFNCISNLYVVKKILGNNLFVAALFDSSNQISILYVIIFFLLLLFVFYFLVKKLKKEITNERKKYEELLIKKNEEIEKLLIQQDKLEKLNLLTNTRLNHKIELIQNISNNLESGNAQRASSIIRNNNQVERKFSDTKRVIENVHNTFYDYLIDMAKEELTAIDLKYCTYIYLNYDSAEMSTIFNVTRKSVRMAKYRIKKKLGLGVDVDLSEFLRNLKY